jgi:hypothetical protein
MRCSLWLTWEGDSAPISGSTGPLPQERSVVVRQRELKVGRPIKERREEKTRRRSERGKQQKK